MSIFPRALKLWNIVYCGEIRRYFITWGFRTLVKPGLLYKLLNEYGNLLIYKWLYVTQGNCSGLQCLRVHCCLLSVSLDTSYCLKSNTSSQASNLPSKYLSLKCVASKLLPLKEKRVTYECDLPFCRPHYCNCLASVLILQADFLAAEATNTCRILNTKRFGVG